MRRTLLPILLLGLLAVAVQGPVVLAQSTDADGPPLLPGLEHLPGGKGPIRIRAEELQYDSEKNVYTAQGRAVVTQEGTELKADRVVFFADTSRIIADGHATLTAEGDRVEADRLEFNMDTSEGVLYEGRIDTREDNYHIQGERMERLSDGLYLIDRGSLTTCDLCEGRSPDWLFRARKLRLRLDHYAVAKGVSMRIKGVPVFYLPYMVFPVKTTRQSGLLTPTVGYSTQEEGFKYLQPVYIVLGRSHDATVSLDYRSEKGMGGILEYRYVLSKTAWGRLETLYFHDIDIRQEQVDVRFQHDQSLTRRTFLKADVNFLNREDVRKDLSTVTEERTQSSVESDLFLGHRTNLQALSLSARYYQNLLSSDDLTLQRLPEIQYALTEFPIAGGPVLFGGQAGLVNFWRQKEREVPDSRLRAVRLDIFPKVWWPLSLGGLATLTPQAGLRESLYSRGLESERPVHREFPFLGLELRSPWVRRYGGMLHFIEPMAFYEYTDALGNDAVPQFDEADLLSGKNMLTYGLTNRLRFRGGSSTLLRLTQSLNLERSGDRLSDLRAEWQSRLTGWFLLDLDALYNREDRRFSSINTDATFRLFRYFSTTAGQRYTRKGRRSKIGDSFNPLSLGQEVGSAGKVEFITLGANFFIPSLFKKARAASPSNGLSLAGQAYFNLDADSFTEIDYGVRYASQCWEIIFNYIDFPEKNQFSFLVTLRGAVTVDSRAVGGLFEEKDQETP